MTEPFFLIPSLADDAALHPAKVLPVKPLAAAQVMIALNRLPKKGKRLFAWVHHTLIAFVRDRLGKSPENVEATLKAVGIEAAIARRGSAWWRDALALRDHLAPMAKGWILNDAEKAAGARAGKGLFDHPDYAAAKAAVIADLSLMACATGEGTPAAMLEALAYDEATDPLVLQALRVASDMAGAGDPAADVNDSDEADEPLSENGYRPQSEVVCDLILPKLAASNQVFLSLTLTTCLAGLVWVTQRPDVLKRCRQAAGLGDDGYFRRLVKAAMRLEDFSRCLAFRLKDVDMAKIRLPNPKTEEAAEERSEKIAVSVWKAIDGESDDLKALKDWLVGAALLNMLFNHLTPEEGRELLGSLDEAARGYFPLCVSTLARLGQRVLNQPAGAAR